MTRVIVAFVSALAQSFGGLCMSGEGVGRGRSCDAINRLSKTAVDIPHEQSPQTCGGGHHAVLLIFVQPLVSWRNVE